MWRVMIDGQSTPLYPGDIIDPTLTMEVSRSGAFDFVIPPTHPLWGVIEPMRTIIRIERDSAPFWSGRVSNVKRDFHNRKTVLTDGALSLLNDIVIDPFTFESSSNPVRGLLSKLIGHYNQRVKTTAEMLTVGTVSTFDVQSLKIVSDEYETVWESINRHLLGVYGGFLRVRNWNVIDYTSTYPSGNQEIKWAENLLDLSEDVDVDELFTVAVPVGRRNASGIQCTVSTLTQSGETTVFNVETARKFGYLERKIEFDTGSPIRLMELAQRKLSNSGLSVRRTFSAVDLADAGVNVQRLSVGTLIHAVSSPHGVDDTAVCTKAVWKLLEPDKNVFDIGVASMTLTARTSVTVPVQYAIRHDESRDAEANKLILSIQSRGDEVLAPPDSVWAANWSLYNGFPAVWMDIQWTSDGVPIMFSRQTINRDAGLLPNPPIKIGDLTAAQLRQYQYHISSSYATPDYVPFTTFSHMLTLLRETDLMLFTEIQPDEFFVLSRVRNVIRSAVKNDCAERITIVIDMRSANGFTRLKTIIREANLVRAKIGIGVWVDSLNVPDEQIEQLKALRNSSTSGSTFYVIVDGEEYDPEKLKKLDDCKLVAYAEGLSENDVFRIVERVPVVGVVSSLHAGRMILERGDPRS